MVHLKCLSIPLHPLDYLFFCCPECDTKVKEEEEFVNHAHTHLQSHPKTKDNFDPRTSTDLEECCKKEDSNIDVKDEITPHAEDDEDYDDFDMIQEDASVEIKDEMNEEIHLEIQLEEEDTFDDKDEEFHDFDGKNDMSKSNQELSKNDDKSHICWECQKGFTRLENLRRHMKTIHKHKNLYKCFSCDITFLMAKSFNLHKEKLHSNEEQTSTHIGELTKQNSSLDTKELYRRKNKAKMEKKAALMKTKYKLVNEKYTCLVCSFWSSDEKAILSHVSKKHSEKKFVCESCGRGFSMRSSLNIHIEAGRKRNKECVGYKDTGEEPYQCPECTEVFDVLRTLSKHMLEKHGHDRFFKCIQCNVSFKALRRDEFERHKNVVHGDTPAKTYDCKLCPFVCNTMGSLNRHIARVHNTTDKLVCSQCPRTFGYMGDLKTHFERIHTRNKTYRCPFCEDNFETKNCLIDHQVQTHGRQAFECKECDARFISKTGLDGHVKEEHERDFSLKCPNCPAVYASQKNLKRHIQRNHVEKRPFICDICKMSFTLPSDLKAHVKLKHTKDIKLKVS